MSEGETELAQGYLLPVISNDKGSSQLSLAGKCVDRAEDGANAVLFFVVI